MVKFKKIMFDIFFAGLILAFLFISSFANNFESITTFSQYVVSEKYKNKYFVEYDFYHRRTGNFAEVIFVNSDKKYAILSYYRARIIYKEYCLVEKISIYTCTENLTFKNN